jgi:hypothetical protein
MHGSCSVLILVRTYDTALVLILVHRIKQFIGYYHIKNLVRFWKRVKEGDRGKYTEEWEAW